jgi:hypothetical protein
MLLDYLSCLGESPSKDSPLFRPVAGHTGNLKRQYWTCPRLVPPFEED